MTRKELISSPEYWTTNAQLDLFNCATEFMKQHDMNRKQLAEHLNVSKSYVTQLLNGDFDHRLSKFMELSLAFGYVPKLSFEPLEDFIANDDSEKIKWNTTVYDNTTECVCITLHTNSEFTPVNDIKEMEVA